MTSDVDIISIWDKNTGDAVELEGVMPSRINSIAPGVVIPVDVSGAPILPIGGTRISQAYDISTSGNSSSNYTVSTGKKLIIQIVFCSLPNGEQADKQLKVRFQFRPSGGPNIFKATLYAQDSKPFPNILNNGDPQPWLEAGDIFRTRFINDSGINSELYAGWIGYEIDL